MQLHCKWELNAGMAGDRNLHPFLQLYGPDAAVFCIRFGIPLEISATCINARQKLVLSC